MSDIYEESMSQHSTSDVDCDSRAEHHHQDNDSSALTLQSDDLYKSEGLNNLDEEESKHADRHLMLLEDLKNQSASVVQAFRDASVYTINNFMKKQQPYISLNLMI